LLHHARECVILCISRVRSGQCQQATADDNHSQAAGSVEAGLQRESKACETRTRTAERRNRARHARRSGILSRLFIFSFIQFHSVLIVL